MTVHLHPPVGIDFHLRHSARKPQQAYTYIQHHNKYTQTYSKGEIERETDRETEGELTNEMEAPGNEKGLQEAQQQYQGGKKENIDTPLPLSLTQSSLS